MLELLHHRVALGFPTFVKVRAVSLLWNAPSGRIIYQFAPDASKSEDVLYSASMNDTVKKFIKNQAALSSLYFSPTPGFTESFLRRPHSSRDLLGACLADSSFPDGAKKRLIQSVGLQFLCRALLRKEDSPNCPFCNERESLGHIQSRCKILGKPRIAAHHMIWRKILLQLFGLSGDEGEGHKWVIPSAVSADFHKELTVRQIIQHFGFFASDAALEDKISVFFASVHYQTAILRIHQKSKRVAILEFTRAMDSDDWETKKDAEKRARYAPVLDFFNSLPKLQNTASNDPPFSITRQWLNSTRKARKSYSLLSLSLSPSLSRCACILCILEIRLNSDLLLHLTVQYLSDASCLSFTFLTVLSVNIEPLY